MLHRAVDPATTRTRSPAGASGCKAKDVPERLTLGISLQSTVEIV